MRHFIAALQKQISSSEILELQTRNLAHLISDEIALPLESGREKVAKFPGTFVRATLEQGACFIERSMIALSEESRARFESSWPKTCFPATARSKIGTSDARFTTGAPKRMTGSSVKSINRWEQLLTKLIVINQIYQVNLQNTND